MCLSTTRHSAHRGHVMRYMAYLLSICFPVNTVYCVLRPPSPMPIVTPHACNDFTQTHTHTQTSTICNVGVPSNLIQACEVTVAADWQPCADVHHHRTCSATHTHNITCTVYTGLETHTHKSIASSQHHHRRQRQPELREGWKSTHRYTGFSCIYTYIYICVYVYI